MNRMMRDLLKANQVDTCFVESFEILPFLLHHASSPATTESVYAFLQEYLLPSKRVWIELKVHG